MNVNIFGMATRTAVWATQAQRPMVRLGCGAAAILPFLAATSVSAQQPGDTVRVSGSLVGVVIEADSAGLRLSSGYAPYTGMRSLELWGGTGTQAGRGFKSGFVVGGLMGALLVAATCPDAPGCDFVEGLGAVGLIGLSAGLVGSVIGSAFKRDIWTPVPIPGGLSLRVAVGGT